MEHIAAFMLLIACSNDLEVCEEIPAPAVAYETVQQCERELTPAVNAMDASQKKSYGTCVEIDPALVYEDAEIVWDVTQAGGIEVSVELINPDVELNSVARAESPATATQIN